MEAQTCDKPRILFVIGSLDMGGAEKQMVLLASHLSSLGFQCGVFSLSDGGILKSDLTSKGIRVFSGGLREHDLRKSPWKLLITFLKLLKTAYRWGPDVVHSFLPLATFLGAICGRLCRVPLIISGRRALGTHQDRIPITKPLDYIAYKLSHRITVNSKAVWDDMIKRDRIDPAKMVLIYNGIPSTMMQPASRYKRVVHRENRRRVLGISPDEKAVICVANLIPYKGHEDLLQALSFLRSHPLPITVFFIGEDRGILKNLEASAAQLYVDHMIHFLGKRTDIPQLLNAGDLFVLPSHEEGFSNVILEAMAAGLPIVTTCVGGNPEAIIQGKTGWLVQPGNPHMLSEKIIDLLEDPAKSTRWDEWNMVRARDLFSIDKMINEHIKLYHQAGCIHTEIKRNQSR